ncbi:Inactive pancreatic lipase-related protein 1 [Halotydeus destructor]|nr:Inactive pancreatic lipase-related protein 1 [Halotydeus destructor]
MGPHCSCMWLLEMFASSQKMTSMTFIFVSCISFAVVKGQADHMHGLNSVETIVDSVSEVGACLTGTGFTNSHIGAFNLSDARYCDCDCGRCIPGILCCAPQAPEAFRPHFRLIEAGQPERDLIWTDVRERETLTGPIVFVVHGWIEKVSTSPWIMPIALGWVGRGRKVIIVDWRHGNQIDYFQAMANVRVVGAMIGYAILNWQIAHRTLFVGFSLGAHIAGEAGRFTQQHGGIKIRECHGLDPAGPFFDGCSDSIQLRKSDCELVQAVHTSAEDVPTIGFLYAALGSYAKSGHCDYWLNCGYSQEPCIDFRVNQLVAALKRLFFHLSDGQILAWIQTQICSHWRAPLVYLSQLVGSCHFGAEVCEDCGLNRNCHGSGITSNQLPPDGRCNSSLDINYYVKSGPVEPYC